MRSPFSGIYRATLASLPILVLICSNVHAQEYEEVAGRGLYVGVFGGGGAFVSSGGTTIGTTLSRVISTCSIGRFKNSALVLMSKAS